jgi:hypothetical protein
MLGAPMRPSVFALAFVIATSSTAGATAAEGVSRDVPPGGTKPGYLQLSATAFVGDGLRFNNPYRLATPLGSNAESVSRTAAYTDLGLAVTLGNPLGLQHGVALRASFALEGVGQAVLVPAYLAWRRWRAWAVYGRAGIPIVMSPDATWGGELSGGGVFFVRAGIGVAAELVGDLFYGAGTREVARPAYPVLSAQLGAIVTWEVLP